MSNRLKKRWAVLTAVGCAIMLAGCNSMSTSIESAPPDASDTSEAKSEVVIAISSEPESGFDPTVGWGHGTTPLIQSTLIEYTQDRRIVNDLAAEYTVSSDGKTWVFALRDDAFFTDGEPVTAADVVFTFLTAKNSASSLDITSLERCEATDEREVTFTLNAPNSTFINTIATIGIVPEHAYGDNYANQPIGSGPWKFVQWNKGEQIILAANENYYGDVPAIQKATLVFMDEDAAFAAAQAGQVDVALTSASHATQEINGMHIEAITTLDNRGLTLPTTPAEGRTSASGHPVGNDVTSHRAIRQAIAYAIDREQLALDALGGFGTPAYSENDGMPWNNPAVRIETDRAYAKQLLTEDGWSDTDSDGIVEKNGLKAQFTCIYPSGDSVRQAVAMAAAAQAKEIGIQIDVEGTSWDDISKRMFSEAVLMGWGSSNPHTSYLLYHSDHMLQDDYYNPEGFSSPTIDAHLDAALHAASIEEAYKQWQLAQWDGMTGTTMQGECPWVWLVNVQHVYYVADGLDIGEQQLHVHGASWTLVQNLREWAWE